MKGKDIPDDFPEKDDLYPDADEWVNPGDSVVIAPGGQIVAGPMRQEEGIILGTHNLIALHKGNIAAKTNN